MISGKFDLGDTFPKFFKLLRKHGEKKVQSEYKKNLSVKIGACLEHPKNNPA